ncbi:hypothetical protein TNCV_3274851 [Trichonephila clavipes]|uniref:HTH psq-type domain-containing protein n=1 Tax=Trichonephila clavipes TaxID=2585209 RepID=A0A8X6SMB8_TRICX|nr:hypothetical protein TNCV_3274851 [Trichonephila clavipes]
MHQKISAGDGRCLPTKRDVTNQYRGLASRRMECSNMARNYIKKTSDPRYTKDDMKKAVLEVKNGSSIEAASKKFIVPEETVRRWS